MIAFHTLRRMIFLMAAVLPAQGQTIEFNRDIRPILSDTCYKCHGPDKATRKADLRLDLESAAKAKLGEHYPIVPGEPARSELIARITTDDADDRMPPADSGQQLTAQQISLLQRWIEQGAPWQTHCCQKSDPSLRMAEGRKNWMHLGSQESGLVVAAIMSVIASAQRAGHNVRDYLADVFEHICAPSFNVTRLSELLPGNWKPAAPAKP